MNTIFVDMYKENKGSFQDKNKLLKLIKKIKSFKERILKFKMYVDYINDNNLNRIMYIDLYEEFFKEGTNKLNIKIGNFIKKSYIKKYLNKIEKLNIVFSKEIDNNILYRKKILEFFNIDEKILFNVVEVNNTMVKNDIQYINNYIDENEVNKNKLKILMILNDISDYNQEKLLEYISKYKFVDILKMDGISKIDHTSLRNKIDSINKEFGTSIEIISKKNIQHYDVYAMYSKISKLDFITKYILKKESKYIDINNPDEDEIVPEMLQFKKSKFEINTILERLNAHIDNFSQNKLGAWYMLFTDNKVS